MRAKRYEFGPFELDPAQQQLRRRGTRVRLPVSRLRMLLLLVSRHGDLITREEIAACLWTHQEAVDMISGINTAIKQLRAHLGDDPSSPEYIETVVGAGYRFIAEVREIEAPDKPATEIAEPPSPASNQQTQAGEAAPTEAQERPATQATSSGSGRRAAWLAAAALVIGAPIAFFLLQASSHRMASPIDLRLARVTESGDVESADISPDGRYVAYVRQTGGERALWLKQLSTERLLKLTELGSYECPGIAFAPDGNYVYFVRKKPLEPSGELERVPFLGGAAAPVLEGISGAPAISPDGRTVAFVRSTLETHGEDSVVTAAMDGSGERVLETYEAPGIHFDRIAWTADGKWLVFPLQRRLMSIPAEGGMARPVTDQQWEAIDDLWNLPHSDELLLVGRMPESASSQVFEVSITGGQVKQVTHDLANYMQVRTTADGRSLVAVQDVVLSTIQTLNPATGSAVKTLSPENQSRDGVTGLAWTPEGTIVYDSDPDRHRELMSMDGDGGNPHTLARSDMHGSVLADPAVSARGDFIAVSLWANGDAANIWRMNLDGTSQKKLTTGAQDFPPAITPDGNWVVYGSVQGKRSVLMKVPSEGGPSVQLTDYYADNPAVSPDGKWIACLRIPRGDQPETLAIVPIEGGPPAKVFPLPETATHLPLNWTPDGRAVSFVNDMNGISNIWKQPLQGGPASPVTAFTSDHIFYFRWASDGRIAVSRGTETVDAVLIDRFR
jgi:Tol biopolymer transport system component/DNA-binding winged helix-turn-helix (wHTH) protein